MIKKLNFLVIVVGLLLVSPLALAAKPDCIAEPTHPSCKDPQELHYLVDVIDLGDGLSGDISLYHPSDTTPYGECTADRFVAMAHSHMTNFSGHFERGTHGCADLTYLVWGTTNKTGFIWNISFKVIRDKKTGAIESVKFQGQARDPVTDEPFVYDSDALVPDWVVPHPETDKDFIIHLHAEDVPLYICNKARLIGSTVCDYENPVGTFAIDYMDYYHLEAD